MPRALSHAVVLTDDLEATLRFVADVAKISPVSPVTEGAPDDYSLVFGWPLEQAATRSAFVGEGAGMLEVVEIPAPLRGTVAPGVRLLAVANRDAAAGAEAARDAGFDVRGPLRVTSAGEHGATIAEVVAGGVAFELIQFGG
jgi:catechol 2,3-dioxygenase-like lactoylglutathione lyase family enzyme